MLKFIGSKAKGFQIPPKFFSDNYESELPYLEWQPVNAERHLTTWAELLKAWLALTIG